MTALKKIINIIIIISVYALHIL